MKHFMVPKKSSLDKKGTATQTFILLFDYNQSRSHSSGMKLNTKSRLEFVAKIIRAVLTNRLPNDLIVSKRAIKFWSDYHATGVLVL